MKAYLTDYEKFLNVPNDCMRIRARFSSSETPLDSMEGWSGYSAYTWVPGDEGGYDFVAYDFVGEHSVLDRALQAWGIAQGIAQEVAA